MKHVKHIFWDWNGTLLNDVDLCVHVTGKFLKERHDKLLDREMYLSEFGFPVIDFYKKIGIDLKDADYGQMSIDWIGAYNQSFGDFAELHSEVGEVILALQNLGYKQSILSACEKGLLETLVKKYQLWDHFESVHGVEDFKAHGKVDLAHSAVQLSELKAEECVLIGDTIHDYEVAQEVGMQCLLIAKGHQHIDRLKATGCEVLDDISQVVEKFKNILSKD
ncbi:HAD hydrolase-like protein [Lentisphaera marina]|uniref:HAD family hydrolase n=1 Tax=Lentisphaera marina TaxID=1111041 RepID=UPI002366A5F4|nr:HAD hydrolase-like protein [Lentisphaera marina]MDD7985606.1 HAD hydrolase-like protein [Lentisphaera marina]